MANGRIWTEEEVDYLEKWAGAHSLARIAKKLGRSHSAVHSKIHRLGTAARDNTEYMTANQVAQEYGCPPKRVHQFIAKGILPAKPFQGKHKRWLIDPAHAERIAVHLRQKRYQRGGHLLNNSKLNEQAVADIRERAKTESYSVIAASYGVNKQTAWRAAKGKSWQHLKPTEWWEKRIVSH